MSRVRSKNTKPEMLVRRLTHALGYRFRLHGKDLPGSPDLVFPKLNKAIFVHGCFWHRHPRCPRATLPKTNIDFWQKKLADNVARDEAAISSLSMLGWTSIIVWECETKHPASLTVTLARFLGDSSLRQR